MPDTALTPPDAARVFCGYRGDGLDSVAFLTELGRTFMPGTPYMLQPLGLHAYLAAVIKEGTHERAPHEVALIAYPSQSVYRAIRNSTLAGRVYTAIHGGVFKSGVSAALFPTPIPELSPSAAPAAGTFHLLPNAVDWQYGSSEALVAVRTDKTAADFLAAAHAWLATAPRAATKAGLDQALVAIRDDFIAMWNHAPNEAARVTAPFYQSIETFAQRVAQLTPQRQVCVQEPPVVTLTDSMAVNFIFPRHPLAQIS